MDSNSSNSPAGGWPEKGGDDGVAAGNGKTPDLDGEQVRDRRLLRFVYATAALTGVLAVVIYAGGWFFDTPDQSEQASGKPAQMASKPPQADPSAQEAGKPKVEGLERLESSDPPAPPAPVAPAAPATETAAVPRSAGEPAPSETTGGMADDAAARGPGQAAMTGAGEAAPTATTQPQTDAPPSKPPEPVKAAQETAPAKPAPKPAPAAEAKAPPPAPKEPAAVATAVPRATGAPSTSATGRYYAQLGSVTSAAGAEKFWARVQKKFPDILGEYDLVVQKRAVANRGTFYRVQVGRFATFTEVRGLCDMLKARKQGCLPVKR